MYFCLVKFLKNLFDFYIDSSIHVTLAACGFVGVSILEFDISITDELLGFLFFGTITGYNFVKYAEIARLKHRSLNLSLRKIQIFSFFCFLALVYYLFQLPFKTLLVTGGFAALTFFYAIPFLTYKKLRALVGMKIIIVAIVWSGVTLIIPLVNENVVLTNSIWIGFFQRILFVLVLTLPFEIRDLKYDELALGTLPQKVGMKSTKIIGTLLLLVILLIEFLKPDMDWIYAISLMLICGVMAMFLYLSEKDQAKYFASFWVESIPIFWFVILMLLKII